MSIQKGFLSKNAVSISKKKVIVGVILALGISFCLYASLCGLRMMLILMENNYFNNGPIILTPYERYWQNFSFALVALMIGHSVFLITVFSRPVRFNFSNYKRTAIVNSQVFLGFNFYYLFFKLFFLVGLILPGFLTFPELKGHSLVIYLAAIVLFLESWKVILRVFRKKAYKYMFISALFVLTTAFLFALISVFDYKKMDRFLLENNPKIDLPVTDFETVESSLFRPNLIRVIKIYKENETVKYYYNDKSLSFQELMEKDFIESVREIYRPFLTFYLFAPSDISMYEIKKVQKLLYINGFRSIKYITVKPDGAKARDQERGIYGRYSFDDDVIHEFYNYILENYDVEDYMPIPPPPVFEVFEGHIIDVKINKDNYFINEKKVSAKNLKSVFSEYIDEKNTFHFIYPEEETTYQEYLTVYSAYREAVDSLRKNIQKTELKFDRYLLPENEEEYREDQDKVKAIYPMKYIENDNIPFIVLKSD